MISWITDIPDHLKTKKMSNDIMCINPEALILIPDHLETKNICIETVEADPLNLT